MLNFQEMIAHLTAFWVKQGCIAHQGYDLEVGAGTFNPATFLRAMGPEPYSAVYVEPSRRPQDGRYGENPNRVQHYHQMQVILKPSPSNILELYVQSLESIGLNLKEHDIRFVHDDWENPTIGAAGLGWEVWLDGMEISQFTYFQIIGGLPVKPVSGEITYGLERIAMYLQKSASLFDIQWSDDITYGEIFKRSEWEWSHYNFNEASVDLWRQHFEDFEKEAKRLILSGFPLPAYDFIMKASHAFNILEARGVISVTERTGYITRIRNLAKELAERYVKLREELNFPLLKNIPESPSTSTPFSPSGYPSVKAPFLLEIGSEELPHTFVPIGMANLERKMKGFLEAEHLSHGKISVFGTPRRLAILIEDLPATIPPTKTEKRGPSVNLAFDEKGALTSVGQAFFRAQGLTPCSLREIEAGSVPHLSLRSIKDTLYIFATIEDKEKSTPELLSTALPSLIADLNFPKKMKWGSFDFEYPRPIRWIVSLYGNKVIPFRIADVEAGRETRGHRQINPPPFTLNDPKEYLSALRAHDVIVDSEERSAEIARQLREIEAQLQVKIVAEAKVLPIVCHLVEKPFLMVGSFDEAYLRAPQEVLISEMVEHQKYFPLQKREGSLTNQFIITANNIPSPLIREGNEKALAPRLADGLFLYELDLKTPLENFNEKLKSLTFQKPLGSLFAKVHRLISYVKILHSYIPIAPLDKVLRAAFLCKADLTSELVKEFPDLQGYIGNHYALKSGEEPSVAEAIGEHWMPRGEHSPLPQSPSGILVSLADKIDNLLSCFALGLLPTSSSDPYALRRQTVGLIKIIIENSLNLPLPTVFNRCFEEFLRNPEMDPSLRPQIKEKKETLLSEIAQFIKNRLRSYFSENDFSKDEIEAILSKDIVDIFSTYGHLQILHDFRKKSHPAFLQILTLYHRSKKILVSSKSDTPSLPDPSLFQESAERELYARIGEIKKIVSSSHEEMFSVLAGTEPFLAHLFDTSTIMHEDDRVKKNRLGLLQEIVSLCDKVADFSKIQEHDLISNSVK